MTRNQLGWLGAVLIFIGLLVACAVLVDRLPARSAPPGCRFGLEGQLRCVNPRRKDAN